MTAPLPLRRGCVVSTALREPAEHWGRATRQSKTGAPPGGAPRPARL